ACEASSLLRYYVAYDWITIGDILRHEPMVLNQIVCELPTEHPLSNVRPLRELLGHTPLQMMHYKVSNENSCHCIKGCMQLGEGKLTTGSATGICK
ncbi:hypothetical protein FRX31_032099, partial [Thalictrum thalictroides]